MPAYSRPPGRLKKKKCLMGSSPMSDETRSKTKHHAANAAARLFWVEHDMADPY
jgi:hypothetical protein